MIPAAGWQGSPFSAPAADRVDTTFGDLLAGLAQTNPAATAIIDGEVVTSFGELAGLVGGLARQILAADAPAGPIALLQPQGALAIAACFACALAGRPFLLLEPHNPPARNAELAAIAGATLILQAAGAPIIAGLVPVVPDGRMAPITPGAGLTPDAAAMIFPTSGSTGEPKLVAYATRTLLAKAQASRDIMRVGAGDIVLIAGSHGNFGFLHHAMVFLVAGGTVCLADLRQTGLGGLFATVRTRGVGHVRFTPSLFRAAAEQPEAGPAFAGLRGVRFSGEPLLWNDVALARRLLPPTCMIQNIYGSTESAIFAWTDDGAQPIGDGVAPIGRIYPSWHYAVVPDGHDAQTAAAPEGRLLARSAFQALGDWTQGAISRDRFAEDPSDPARQIYDTGDIVRQELNGDLTMLGRADRLVKVNGFRVSLAEIEAHLRAMPGCTQAGVIAHPEPRGVSLAAFFTCTDRTVPAAEYRAWLAARLPPPMQPAFVRQLATLPLLPGGKLDYRALAALVPPRDADAARQEAGAAVPDAAARLCRLWNDSLGLPDAAQRPDEDFFDLGGDSLRMLELRIAIERDFSAAFEYRAFLDRPTLRWLFALLGIDDGALPMPRQDDGLLRFRLARAATGPSRGVALAMPGWSGSPRIQNWLDAGVFEDYDVWTCTLTSRQGNLLRHDRWVETARTIATAIRSGACPAPTILSGFSMAGYIAWQVDRLLGDAGQTPRVVVCLDATPLHHRPEHRRRAMAKGMSFLSGGRGRMLLVRRAPLHGLEAAIGAMLWTTEDAALSIVPVRTLDHADMDRVAVLRAVRTKIRAYLSSVTSLPDGVPRDAVPIDTDSGRLYEMLASRTRLTPEQVYRIVEALPATHWPIPLPALQELVLRDADLAVASLVVDRIVRFSPDTLSPRYAALALRDLEKGVWTGPDTGRSDAPLESLDAVDRAIAMRRDNRTGRSRLGSRYRRLQARIQARLGLLTWQAASKAGRLIGRLRPGTDATADPVQPVFVEQAAQTGRAGDHSTQSRPISL